MDLKTHYLLTIIIMINSASGHKWMLVIETVKEWDICVLIVPHYKYLIITKAKKKVLLQ